MQTAARSNLVLTEFPSMRVLTGLPTASRLDEFYREIAQKLIRDFYNKESRDKLGNKLIAVAHHGYTVRQVGVVERASQMLINLPLPRQYRSIGWYYHSSHLRQQGQIAEARNLLERLTDEVPHQYRARVIMSLAGLVFDSGDFKSAMPLYIEAGRAARDRNWRDWLTSLTAQRMLAVLKSTDGDNRGALACLEDQFPLARAAGSLYPHEFCNYLNSLAIELGEVGRLEEARNVSRKVLASPYASAYPEWQETWDEIERKGYRTPRSVVSLAQRAPNAPNVLHLLAREHGDSSGSGKHRHVRFQQQATVTSLQDWKQKMVKQPNGDHSDEKAPRELDDREMLLKILELSTIKGLPDEALREMVEALKKVVAKYTNKDQQED